MTRVFIHEQAERDLASISAYIRRHNPDAADAFETAAMESVALLAAHPLLGPKPRFTFTKHPHLRFWVISRFPNYLIFYEDEPTLVSVVRVLHGARDPERVFKKL